MSRCAESEEFDGSEANKVTRPSFFLSRREEASVENCIVLPFDDLNVGPLELHALRELAWYRSRAINKKSKLAHACLARETSSFAKKKGLHIANK